MGQYLKFVVAVLGAVASVLAQAGVHATWAVAVVAAATALGVYMVPNAKRNSST